VLRHVRAGFTLVEILIVVTILAIVAMAAIPEYGRASTDARESRLGTDIETVRKQIDLYRLQHGGRSPHLDDKGNEDTANFASRLLNKTDATGKPDGALGPYLLEWPTNPFADPATAGQVTFGTAPNPPRDGKTGWYYSASLCRFSANSAGGGKAYDPAGATAVTTGG